MRSGWAGSARASAFGPRMRQKSAKKIRSSSFASFASFADPVPLPWKRGRATHAVVAIACVALSLGGCATHAPRADLPAIAGDPQAHQAAREAALAAAPDWGVAGRVAVSKGKDGGSGRLDWRQRGARYEVSLSAPVTRQSWRLSGQPGQALLEGLDGGPREGRDAAALLREATRWEIPVEALSAWIRGAAAGPGFGQARYRFAADGRLQGLDQAGWTIDYADWRPATTQSGPAPPSAVDAGATELPHRLTAVRGDAKVRLIVDQWQ